MALKPLDLANEIKTAMLLNPLIQAVDGPALTGFCTALASTICLHLVTNATVGPGSFTTAGGGPVTGGGALT